MSNFPRKVEQQIVIINSEQSHLDSQRFNYKKNEGWKKAAIRPCVGWIRKESHHILDARRHWIMGIINVWHTTMEPHGVRSNLPFSQRRVEHGNEFFCQASFLKDGWRDPDPSRAKEFEFVVHIGVAASGIHNHYTLPSEHGIYIYRLGCIYPAKGGADI